MASRSGTANGANRDVETACDTVRSGTCMRYGAGPDGERTVGTACDTVRLRSARANGDGAGAAGIAGRVHGFGATGGDADLYGRLRVEGLNKVRPARRRSTSCSSTSPKAVAYSWRTRQLLGHPRGPVGVSEVRKAHSMGEIVETGIPYTASRGFSSSSYSLSRERENGQELLPAGTARSSCVKINQWFFLRRHGPLRTRTTACRARARGDEAL